MNDDHDFDRLRTKLYFTYHQDGILDLVIGLVVVGFALSMATDVFIVLMLSWLSMLLYLPLKQAVTRPRFGYVRFNPQRVRTARLIASVIVGLGVLVVCVVLSFYSRYGPMPVGFETWMRQYHMAVLGGIAGLVAIGAAFLTRLSRFYVYGLLAVALPTAGAWLNLVTYLPILSLGLLIAGSGLILLISFLKKYSPSQQI